MKNSKQELDKKAYEYRKRFLELFTKIGFGHVTSAFSWTEIATVLYNEIVVLPNDLFDISECDKMVVSKGHGAGMLFPIFEDIGLFSREEIDKTIAIGGNNRKLRNLFYPGFDFYGGSLGIGLGIATGLAKSKLLSEKKGMIYCLIGDAECYEGSIWEAINFAGHNKLYNLVAIIDRNMMGCSDFTENMLEIEPLADKWKSFNWEVYEVDGHNIQELYDVFTIIKKSNSGKPHCVIANTKKGQGLNYLIDKPLMHGYMPKGEDINKAFQNLE